MTEEPLISIRGRGDDHLLVTVRQRQPDHLEVTVDLAAGAMRATYPAQLSLADLADFQRGLEAFLAGDAAGAHFAPSPSPSFLEFDLSAWPDGVLVCRGTAVDATDGNLLAFSMTVDPDWRFTLYQTWAAVSH